VSDENEQVMPERPELIVLGKEAREFKSSSFGQYLLDCAARDAARAAQELCVVDPGDAKQIIELQNTTRRLRDLNKWIDEAIQAADNEYAQYRQSIEEE